MEQSCTVWNSSLTKKNERELERVQKVAIKLITRNKNTYEENLKELKIPTLKERRDTLSLNFAKQNLLNDHEKKEVGEKKDHDVRPAINGIVVLSGNGMSTPAPPPRSK